MKTTINILEKLKAKGLLNEDAIKEFLKEDFNPEKMRIKVLRAKEYLTKSEQYILELESSDGMDTDMSKHLATAFGGLKQIRIALNQILEKYS